MQNAYPYIALVLSGLTPFPAASQNGGSARILGDVTYLAADALEGRGVGTAGLDAAADYVARRFAEAGLEYAGTDGYFQAFQLSPTAPAVAHAGLGDVSVRNVVGLIPGSGSLATQTVVIGAHYDHLGWGGMGSLDPDSTGVVHNGADDNASGTAALIEIASLLRDRRGPNVRTLVFVAFTAEELGLIGSAHYARDTTRGPVFAMLNLDMVGRLRNDRLAAFGAATAEEFPRILDQVNAHHGFEISASGDGFGRSDHQSFFEQKVPVLHFFTGTHAEYHRTIDDAETINAEGTARVAAFVADLGWTLATRAGPLTFVDAAPREVTVAPAGGTRPYFGSIPDMTDSPGGVRFSGVTAGSPAANAGLAAGDILVGLGDFEVADLYDMTDALNSYQPGDTVIARIRRGDELIELTVTLGKRGG